MLHIEGGQGACPLKLRNFDNFKSPVDQFFRFKIWIVLFLHGSQGTFQFSGKVGIRFSFYRKVVKLLLFLRVFFFILRRVFRKVFSKAFIFRKVFSKT